MIIQKNIVNILKLLKISIETFYDGDDITLTSKCGTERSSAFRIGHYFCSQIEKSEFKCYKIDMEYNKHGNAPKRNDKNKLIIPDLIVHQRESDDNFLVVEFKHTSKNISCDECKLEYLTNKGKKYGYEIGVLVILEQEYFECRYYIDGKEYKNERIVIIASK